VAIPVFPLIEQYNKRPIPPDGGSDEARFKDWLASELNAVDRAIKASSKTPSRTIESDVLATSADGLLVVDATDANVEVRLPASRPVGGQLYYIKKSDASANTVTITPFGSELIDGAANVVLGVQNESVILIARNGSWTVTGQANIVPPGGITGAGTTNTLAKFTSPSSIGDSLLSESGSVVTVAGSLAATAALSAVTSVTGATGVFGTSVTSPLVTNAGTLNLRTVGANALTIGTDSTTRITVAATGLVTTSAGLTVTTDLTANGNTALGNATSDTLTVTARLLSSLVPVTASTNTLDLGIAATNTFRTGYFGTSVIAPLLNATTRLGVGMAAASISSTVNVDVISTFGVRPSTTEVYPTALANGIPASFHTMQNTAAVFGWALTRVGAITSAPSIEFYKTRSTTGAPSAVSNGDSVGTFGFQAASDGTTIRRAAAITAIVNGTVSAGTVPVDIVVQVSPAADAFGTTGAVWRWQSDGMFRPETTNAYDIGLSGTVVRTVFATTITATNLGGTLTTATQNNVTTMTALTTIGTLVAGAVPLSLVTAGTSPAGTFIFPTLAATVRVTSPLIGTTTATDVIFDRNSVTQLTLGSLLATFAGAMTTNGIITRVGQSAIDGSAPITIRVQDTRSSGSWTTNAEFSRYEFYSDDVSGVGAGVRAYITATMTNAAGSVNGMNFYTANSAQLLNWMRYNAGVEQTTVLGSVGNPFIVERTASGVAAIQTLSTLGAVFFGHGAANTFAVKGDVSLGSSPWFSVTSTAVTGGTYNGQTVSSAASFTGTMAIASTLTTTGTSVVLGNQTAAATVVSIGGTSVSAGSALLMRGVVSAARYIDWQTGTTSRWRLAANTTAESGSDAGSNWSLTAFTDAGAAIDTALNIIRAANGVIAFSATRPVTMGALTASGAVSLSPANANVVLSPTGTGVVTINPATAGTLNNVAIGGSTPLAGAFTDLTIGAANAFYIGPSGTDGTWRLIRSGDDLVIARRESGSYVTKSTILA
jgi:hypothetical protein